jgi:hypothetical protein
MLSPHRRLGRSRTASTREHSEPCPAQCEAPESRQPPPGRDDATRSADPPQHPHRCSSPPPCADLPRPSPFTCEHDPRCRRHQWRTRKRRSAPSTQEETTVLAPCCEEPAPPSGAPTKRSLRPAVPHRGFKRVSPKSRQEAGCARAPHRAVPLRGHHADPMGRRGGGGAARAPQASPQGEKALAILKRLSTSLIRKRHPIGPYSRPMPRALWLS